MFSANASTGRGRQLDSDHSAGPISETPAGGDEYVDVVMDDGSSSDEHINNILVPNFSRLTIYDPLLPLYGHTNYQAGIVTPGPSQQAPTRENTAGHKRLLSQAEEFLRRQIAHKANRLYSEQGPDSSKAFLSALCTLSIERFDQLWAGVLHTPTYNPATAPVSDTGRRPPSSSEDGRSRAAVERSQVWEGKFERFAANATGDLIRLVNSHWEQLAIGLDVREVQGDRFSADRRLRRLYHHLELRKLEQDGELHWLRRALALVRNLGDFEEYPEEIGYPVSEGSNQRFRHSYLTEIYAASSNCSHSDIKTAFKEDLRYAVRWLIFTRQFGLGAILVCGEAISKLVYKTSGNKNGDLEWLIIKIQNCHSINFQALCNILQTPVSNLIRHYCVGDHLHKSEVIAKIQVVASQTDALLDLSLA